MCAVLPFNQWSCDGSIRLLNRLWVLVNRMEELCLIISEVSSKNITPHHMPWPIELTINSSFDVKLRPESHSIYLDIAKHGETKKPINLHSIISMSRIISLASVNEFQKRVPKREFQKDSSRKEWSHLIWNPVVWNSVKFLLISFNIWCNELTHKDLSVLLWAHWLFVATVIGNWIC